MRASATSRTNSAANIPAAQAKADAKADAASPFALLVEMASAKDGAKPAKKDAKDSGDKPANDKSAVKPDGKTAAVQTAPQAPAKPTPSAKAGNPDKTPDKTKDGTAASGDTSDNSQIAPTNPQPVDQQNLPLAPMSQAPLAASSADGDNDDIQIGRATPMAGAAKTPAALPPDDHQIKGAQAPANTGAKPTAPQEDAAASTAGTPDAEAAAAQKAAAGLAVAITDAQTAPPQGNVAAPAVTDAQSAASQNDASSAATAQTATAHANIAAHSDNGQTGNAGAQPSTTVQAVTISDTPKIDIKPAAPRTDSAKPGNVKSITAAKTPATDTAAASTANANIAKADIGSADKTDEMKPNLAEAVSDAPAPKQEPVQAITNAFAGNGPVAPQVLQPTQTAMITQHVQVTAQTAPNLPALAVEIAAKSQSGAKQFDIRLDPPELGRVDVRLSIDATGKASAHLSADQPQTLTLLQKDAPILARALREAGLDVSQDGLNFSLRQQSHGQNSHDGDNGRFGSSRAFSLAAIASIDPNAAIAAYRGVVDGRLDIRV